MNKLTTLSILLLTVILTGCGSRPDHAVNWHYYWQEGQVIVDMARTAWIWGPQATMRGLSSPHKTQNMIGLGDACIALRAGCLIVQNKYDPTVTVAVEVPGAEGIDSVAITIAHEFKHVWVYQQWQARIGQTGMIAGYMHSDTDAIPDTVETNRTAGSIGAWYKFSEIDPDSFDMGSQDPNWRQYLIYGDNEILAREEGFGNPRTVHPEKDWSKGGKQWRH